MTLSSSLHLEVTASYLPKLDLQRNMPWHVRSLTAYSLFSRSKRLVCSVTQREIAYKSKLNIS